MTINGVNIKNINRNSDERGWLCELYRNDEISKAITPAMLYISETQPGVVRGPHEHREQVDFFIFIGPSDFKLFLWDNRLKSLTFGKHEQIIVGESNPCSVVVPNGVVHAYENIGNVSGIVLNAPNKLYRGKNKLEKIDEIRHEHNKNSIFKINNRRTR